MGEMNSLKQKTITSMITSFSGTIGIQVIQLIIEIVLARLLLPKDFGILGMVVVFIVLSQVFIDSGFSIGLIREKNSSQEDYSTIFIFNLGMASVLYIILYASAGFISEFFREPLLVDVLRVLALVLFINAFGFIQRTILIKNIDFKTTTGIDFLSAVVSGVIAIIAALLGFGVWSLVLKTLLSQLCQTLLLTIANRWKPTLTFNYSSFKRLFGFSWKLLLATILSRLYENLYYIIIGRSFTLGDLGFYSKARGLEEIAETTITNTVQKVSFPVFSHIGDDEERLRNGYRRMIKTTSYIAFPMMLGLSAVAPQLLRIILGDKWISAIPYFQLLCFAGALYPINALNLNILQVKGRSDLYLFLSILRKVIGLIMIGIILFFNFGIMGLVWVSVINSYITFFLDSAYSKKLICYSTGDQLKDFSGYFIISVLMFIGIQLLSSYAGINIVFLLVIQIFFGVAFYVCVSWLLKLDTFYEIRDIIKSVLLKIMRRNVQ